MISKIAQKYAKYQAASSLSCSMKRRTLSSSSLLICYWFNSNWICLRNWCQIEKSNLLLLEILITWPRFGLVEDFLPPCLVKTWWGCSTLRTMRTMSSHWQSHHSSSRWWRTRLYRLSTMLGDESFLAEQRMASSSCGNANSSPLKAQPTAMDGKECHAWKLRLAQSLNFNGVATSKFYVVSMKGAQWFWIIQFWRRRWRTTSRWFRFQTKLLKWGLRMTNLKIQTSRSSWLLASTSKESTVVEIIFSSTMANMLRFTK